MSFFGKLSTTHIDILKEVGNIGAGHAATALSRLLNKKVDMRVPSVQVVTFNEVMDLLGGSENVVASVFLRVEGDAPGSMFFILSLEQASRFIQHLTNDPTFSMDFPPYSELAISALQELGNILTGSYLSSFSDFTKLNLYPTVPAISVDMIGAIISFGLIELSTVSDYAIIIDTALIEEDQPLNESIKGHFFYLPDPESFTTIFLALGVPDNE